MGMSTWDRVPVPEAQFVRPPPGGVAVRPLRPCSVPSPTPFGQSHPRATPALRRRALIPEVTYDEWRRARRSAGLLRPCHPGVRTDTAGWTSGLSTIRASGDIESRPTTDGTRGGSGPQRKPSLAIQSRWPAAVRAAPVPQGGPIQRGRTTSLDRAQSITNGIAKSRRPSSRNLRASTIARRLRIAFRGAATLCVTLQDELDR